MHAPLSPTRSPSWSNPFSAAKSSSAQAGGTPLGPALLLAAIFMLPSPDASATVRRVPSELPTIQAAIDAAELGDTVLVAPGVYRESLEISGRSLSLRSEGGRDVTTLDGEGERRILRIEESTVEIKGLTFFRGTSANGGGISAADADLVVEDCVFRENVIKRGALRESGGAIFFSRDSRLTLSHCTFVQNESDYPLSEGTSVSYSPRDWPTGGAGGVMGDWDARLEVDRCSFLHDQPLFGSVFSTSGPCVTRIDRSVFIADFPWDRSEFLRGAGVRVECTSFWNGATPQIDDFPFQDRSGARKATCVDEDPRLCRDDPESVHASSPLLGCGECGPIGDLHIGCTGPLVLGVREPSVDPIERKMLRVYGYGLDAVDEVELVSPTGQIRSSRSLQHDDAWLVTTMDLSVADPGTWGARFLANAELVLAVDRLIDVLPFAVYAFKDPWVSTAREVDLVLAETGWSPEYALQLVHAEDESRAPLEVVDALQPDTLRVSVDLTGMPEGIYDLEVSGPGLKAMRVAGVLYLGDPPVVRVPEDHSTISAAIAQAPAGARIEIAAGDYHEAIRIDRPLQIASAGEPLRARLLPPDGVEARVIHVLETAGRITRLEGLRIESGRPAEGSGGGVLAETPITVADCRLYNNWVAGNGSGGGAFLAPGSQVLRSQFIANLAPGVEDQWVAIPFGANGTAGGLYCEHCRVDRNHIRGNQAGCSGGAVVSGLFRENEVGRNTSRAFRGHIDELSVQGDVIGNHFENSCGVAYPPSVCIFGPSRAAYNTFTDYWWDMCSYLSLIQLQGPVEFTHNSLAGVGLQVCTQTQQVDLGPKNQILVHDNLILFDPYDATPPWIGYCDQRLGPGPVQSVDLSRISAGCNLGSPFPIYSPSGEIPCPDCVYPIDPGFCEVRYTDGYDSFGEFNLRLRPDSPALPGHSPIGCADTLGALPAGCEEVPVLVSGARLARTEAGVELRWWTLQDIDLDGFHVFRHSAEESVRLTNDPLAPCGECVFLDDEALALSGELSYELLILLGGSEERYFLGTIGLDNGDAVEMGSPRPNPMQASGSVSFALPAPMEVTLEVFDVGGRAVRTLHRGLTAAGIHHVAIRTGPMDEGGFGSGVYWLQLRAGREIRRTRLIVIP